jgi:hypothetical protein
MSKDHTRLADGELDCRVEGIKTAQNTVTELERINERSRRYICEMQNNMDSLSEELTGSRRVLLAQLEEIERISLDTLHRLNGNVEDARQELDAISQQVSNSSDRINQILEEKRHTLSSAVDWYNEVKTEYLLSKDNPLYRKFAPDKLLSLQNQIDFAETITDWSTESVQTFVQLRMSEIYQLDVCVSDSRRKYEEVEIETSRLAFCILENAQALRNKLMLGKYNVGQNIDYWTGSRFRDVEKEVSDILERLKSKRLDPDFGIDDIKELLTRLKELDKAKDMLAKVAIENVRLSGFCKSEVLVAGKLLEQKHKFKLVDSGYEDNDNRKSFIARYRRDDGAEVEFIGAYGEEKGTIQLIRRINTSAYMSRELLDTIEDGIKRTLSGTKQIDIESSSSCGPENLGAFSTSISDQVRQNHDIPSIQLGRDY